MTTNSKKLWLKLRDKRFRATFVESEVKRGIPFQMRALLRKFKWSQDELAEQAGLTQGAVSRALNLNYGNLTLNTIIRIAAGFDIAFVGKFVPFSELLEQHDDAAALSSGDVLPFNEEDANLSAPDTRPDAASAMAERFKAVAQEQQQRQQSGNTQKQMAFNFTPQTPSPNVVAFSPKAEPLPERTDEELYGSTDPDKHKQRYDVAA